MPYTLYLHWHAVNLSMPTDVIIKQCRDIVVLFIRWQCARPEEDRICRICGHFIYPLLRFPPLDFSPAYEGTRKSAVTRNSRASESTESNLNVNASPCSLSIRVYNGRYFERKERKREKIGQSRNFSLHCRFSFPSIHLTIHAPSLPIFFSIRIESKPLSR